VPATVLLYTEDPFVERGFLAAVAEVDTLIGLEPCRTVCDLDGRISSLQPDVLVLDLLDAEHNFNLIVDCAHHCKTAVRLNSIRLESAHQMVSAGVRAILSRTYRLDDQLRCLTTVAGGGLWLDPALSEKLLTTKPTPLTCRERQLVELIAHGLKNKEIAAALYLSEGTVKVYLSRLFQKLGIRDRYELAILGLKNLAVPEGAGAPMSHPHHNATLFVMRDDLRQEARWRS